MVLANVCAAEELERLHQPCVYRIHAPPSAEKLENLRTSSCTGLGHQPAGGQPAASARPSTPCCKRSRGRTQAPLVNEVMLRSQSQAAYSPVSNIGHFGLALARYAHFTSPIRRYPDLLVHRALIGGAAAAATRRTGGRRNLSGCRTPAEGAHHRHRTPRRAGGARGVSTATWRPTWPTSSGNKLRDARISGVTRFGLFVTVDSKPGPAGLVPVSSPCSTITGSISTKPAQSLGTDAAARIAPTDWRRRSRWRLAEAPAR